jgi:hypothetical protein
LTPITPAARLARRGLLALATLAPLLGIAGGLSRLGLAMPGLPSGATAAHGSLMVNGFLGAVIGIERAIAVAHPAGWIGPILSIAATILTVSGQPEAGSIVFVLAACAMLAVNAAFLRRQPGIHAALFTLAAACWLVGALLFAGGASLDGVIPWWFDFLLLTIAAERLELTRMLPQRAGRGPYLLVVVGLLTAGSVLATSTATKGGAFYGVGLLALATWLIRYDIARVTLRGPARGLSRFVAWCLIGGYAWLALAGLAWIVDATTGSPLRDAELHAVAIGFVVAMLFGHAPIMLPAIARIRVEFDSWFYLPLGVLHASLAIRFLAPAWGATAAPGSVLNVLAFVSFILVVLRATRLAARKLAA